MSSNHDSNAEFTSADVRAIIQKHASTSASVGAAGSSVMSAHDEEKSLRLDRLMKLARSVRHQIVELYDLVFAYYGSEGSEVDKDGLHECLACLGFGMQCLADYYFERISVPGVHKATYLMLSEMLAKVGQEFQRICLAPAGKHCGSAEDAE